MKSRWFSLPIRFLLVVSALLWGSVLFAQGNSDPPGQSKLRSTTRAQREAARKRAAKQKKGVAKSYAGLDTANAPYSPLTSGLPELATMARSGGRANAAGLSTQASTAWTWPLGQPDYFGVGNFANSPLPTVAPGPIRAITVKSGGGGYQNPLVYVADPTGSGAVASATVLAGVITSIAVTSGGSNYSAPTVIITDGNGIAAGADAFVSSFGTVTGGIRKFVDTLPGLTAAGANNLGKYIPLAVPDTATFPGSDYYRIGLKEYTHRFHTDLAAGTSVRGYYDVNGGGDTANHYLGPLILATRNRPVRVLFQNNLTAGLNLPLDTTYMGAGTVSDGSNMVMASDKRATLHLHGGNSPWISDGTTMQWITPPGGDGQPAASGFSKGFSFQNVPDMIGSATSPIPSPNLTDGKATFYWTNQQSGRLMFYHDHAYGITRLNVYGGEAAGYLLVDPAQESGLAGATVPGTIVTNPATGAIVSADLAHLIPLVIQDKTFVPDNGDAGSQLAAQDPTWDLAKFGGSGSLWFPHVYMPNQNPADLAGASAFGRWDYGPWFWPPQDPSTFVSGALPYPCDSAAYPPSNPPTFPPLMCPGTPNPSGVPEGFMDTPVVNGTAYPKVAVGPSAYRFQILSAGNDRTWNLQLYYAVDKNGVICKGGNNFDSASCTEVSMVPALPHDSGTNPPLCTVATQYPPAGGLTAAALDNFGKPLNGTGLPAGCWPTTWPTDGRDGGVPNPLTAGPPIIQIGAEGGLMPAPAVIPSTPIGYEYNRRSITVLNVFIHGLLLGPAERADVVVDFSAVPAGSIIILYNDAPAPVPAFDARFDYYTGDLDQSMTGGAPSTQPGYGPNTRTLLQFQVTGNSPNSTPFSLPAVTGALPGLFATTQDSIIVPEPAYPASNGGSTTPTYSRIFDTTATFLDKGAPAPTVHTLLPKTIQELFTLDYGRMNATLGVELPLTSFLIQTTIPYGYIDPTTEIVKDGETQLWKITHNGVDTHFIHFHLFTVQVINRVGWDGAVKPPDANELGWKDTVRMNPLEDIIVALKPVKQQNLPWPLPDSIRPMDVTMPTTSTAGFTNVDPQNNPINPGVVNAMTNFGWEYVWHCHILGHEENDMMRPIAFLVPPPAPSSLSAVSNAGAVTLTWQDNSASETGFTLQRDTDPTFPAPVALFTNLFPSSPSDAFGGILTYIDATASAGPYYYRLQAVDDDFKPPLTQAFNAHPPLVSDWSNTAAFGVVITASASVSPLPNALGWNKSPVTVTVTGSDNGGPPVTSVTYSASGAQFIPPTTVPGSTASFVLSAQGVTTVTFYATDGGSSPAQTLVVRIDTTAPAISGSRVPLANAFGWTNGNVTVSFTATDSISGIASVSPPMTLSSQGANQSATGTATDNAGNSASTTVTGISIDKTNPTITAVASPASIAQNNKNVTVTVSGAVADALSGVDPASGSYTISDSAAQPIPGGTFSINANGTYSFSVALSASVPKGFKTRTYTITARAKDKAGNTGSASTALLVK